MPCLVCCLNRCGQRQSRSYHACTSMAEGAGQISIAQLIDQWGARRALQGDASASPKLAKGVAVGGRVRITCHRPCS